MSTPEIAPGLTDTLFSLATSRLRMQEMRFRTFDFGAFSAMGRAMKHVTDGEPHLRAAPHG